MDEMQQAFDEALNNALAKALARGDFDESQLDTMVGNAVQAVLAEVPRVSRLMLKTLKRSAPKMLREHKDLDVGFRRRNYQRWRKAFDLLEMLWVIEEEVGAKFNTDHRPQAAKNEDHEFEALTFLHARALLVAREIICLMHGGYPDGALSRWRTLHELAVTASLIQKHDSDLALRYLASSHFHAYDAAEQLDEYGDRANLQRFSPHEIQEMKERCESLADRLGKEMWNEYGWASPAVNNNPKPNFRQLEKAAGLDHWRPRYKWASQHTHSPHRFHHALLGMAETTDTLLLVGQSNSGMTDPLHMTALTLTIVTVTLLVTKPTLDVLVALNIMKNLSDEIGKVAVEVERSTFQRVRKRDAARRKAKGVRKRPRRRKKAT